MRRVTLTWGAVLLFAAAVPTGALAHAVPTGAQAHPAPAAGTQPQPSAAATALIQALNRGMRQIGGASGAYVVDMTTGQTLYARASRIERTPASVEKLYTTSTALLQFGPTATLTTSVLGTGSVDTSGVWHGTLYLKGGGDPTFGSVFFDRRNYNGSGATMWQLVSNLIHAIGLTGVQGQIVGDGSYFDPLRGTPATGFLADLPDVEGELGALVFNRGYGNPTGTFPQPHPVLYAAQRFILALRLSGVSVPPNTPIYGGPTPAGAQQLATVSSPPIAQLIQLTNTPSDNFLAEMLLKGLGARFGGAGTTAAGAAVVRAELSSKFGITPQLEDGSGLSSADATSPQQVVTVLEQMYSNPDFFNSLAIGGETGTLKREMAGTVAQGVCHGKTGTLPYVAALAGYCQARDGHELAFAFLANGVGDTYFAHVVEARRMATALVKYDG